MTQIEIDSIVRQISAGPRLISMSATRAILDASEYDVLSRIEMGTIGFAWDVASRSSERRREIRIYRNSVIAWLRGDLSTVSKDGRASGLQSVIDDCIPKIQGIPKIAVRAATLWTCWSISSTHGADLIAEGSLEEFSQRERRATQTRLLTRASVVEFLNKRRIQ